MRPAQLGESARVGRLFENRAVPRVISCHRKDSRHPRRSAHPTPHGGPLTPRQKKIDTYISAARLPVHTFRIFPRASSQVDHALCIMKTSWLRARQRSAHPFRVSAAASSSPAATCRSRYFSALRYRRPGSGYPRLIRSNWRICALVPRPCPREWTGYRGRCQTPPRMQPERRQRAAE